MKQRMALAAVVLSVIFTGSGRGQELSGDGCLVPTKIDSSRSHLKWVKDAHGEAKAVRIPVKELRIARLNFAGQTALPAFLQEQIADSLTARGYDDDKEGLNNLRWQIVDAWQQQGYFRARADLSDTRILDESPDTRTMAITATVQAGKQYRLEEIKFGDLGSGSASPFAVIVTKGARFSAAELRALFLIQQDDIFDTHKMQDGMAELRKAYGARGFINMTAVPSTEIDEKTGRITLTLEIEEGKQFRIGHIRVLGLDPSLSRKLLESSELVSGKIFDATRLDEFYRAIPAVLPQDFAVEDYVELRLDDEKGTIDLLMRAPCLAP
jgi:outer membrane protein assembly factor BamA